MPNENQDPKTKALNKKLDEIRQELIDFRKKHEAEMEEDEAFYLGKQWKSGQKLPVDNQVFTIIETELPFLDETNPVPELTAHELNRQQDADVLSAALIQLFMDQRLEIKRQQAERTALKVGTGFLVVDYDPDAKNGMGDVCIKTAPWRHVWLDGAAADIEESSKAMVVFPMTIDEAKYLYPSQADELKEAPLDLLLQTTAQSNQADPDKISMADYNSSDDRLQLKGMVLKEVIFFKDYTLEDIPEDETKEKIDSDNELLMNVQSVEVGKWENHQAAIEARMVLAESISAQMGEQIDPAVSPLDAAMAIPDSAIILELINDNIEAHQAFLEINPKGLRPKYKNHWRKVCRFGHVIVDDSELDVPEVPIPIIPFYCYKDESSILGMSEVRQIKSMQKVVNEVKVRELQGLRLNVNAGWIKDNKSGVSDDDLTNKDGLVITKNPGTHLERLQPGNVSPQLQNRYIYDKASMRNVAGSDEATQGIRPSGVTAGVAIEALQSQNVGRMGLKVSLIKNYSMRLLAEVCLGYMMKYYQGERFVKISKLGDVKRIKYNMDDFYDLKYELEIVNSTLNSKEKQSVTSTMAGLFQRGVIDAETFFTVADGIPYRNEILAKVRQEKAMAMQMQQEQAMLQSQIGEAKASQELDKGDIENAQALKELESQDEDLTQD